MKYKVTLNNRVYEVEVERGEAILAAEYDSAAPAPPVAAPREAAPAAEPAASLPPISEGRLVSSPLPGEVLSIRVSEGETVKKGQLLLLIEAMKMENEVVAPDDARIIQVIARAGASVSTGDPLVVLG